MPNSYTPVYVHFVWATWDREPLIMPEWEARLYATLAKKCEEIQARLLAVNGMANHIHILVRLPATMSLAQVAQHFKGATSHLVNHEICPGYTFRWQGAYSAFSVDHDRLDAVCAYIRNQKRHHAENSVSAEWERTEE